MLSWPILQRHNHVLHLPTLQGAVLDSEDSSHRVWLNGKPMSSARLVSSTPAPYVLSQIWFKIHSTSEVKFKLIVKRIQHDMYLYKDDNYTAIPRLTSDPANEFFD
jgi:hypothetical protein